MADTLGWKRYAQADSTSWVRTCTLPDLVISPRQVVLPLEYSRGTSPQNPMNERAVGNLRKSHTSTAIVNAPNASIPR